MTQKIEILRSENKNLIAALENAEDRPAVMASRDEESLPHDVAMQLVDCKGSPLRIWRTYRGIKQQDLAAQAGLSKSFLSDIENNRRIGSASTLKKIADILDIDIADLLAEDA